MFVDECVIEVVAGSGGNGCVSFRREKYVPRGGPDGGDGGNGGDVALRVSPHLRTLSHLRHTPRFAAGHGQAGMGKQMFGARGASVLVEVPPGTVVRDLDTGELIADAVTVDQQIVLVRGGKGGRGNVHFQRPDRRTPRIAESGRPGEQRRLQLTLRLLADVGLIGLPNVGKSTLLARLSNARPKIADYPFTTLAPILGIVPVGEYATLVFADLPGLIEGASQGKGLGQRFLRHIERTRFLLLLIEVTDPDPQGTYGILRRELRSWSPELGRRESLVCYTKADLLGDEDRRGLPSLGAEPPMLISGHTGEGLDRLLRRLYERVTNAARVLEALEERAEVASEAAGDAPGGVRGDLSGCRPGGSPGDQALPWPHRWIVPERRGALPREGHNREGEA
jgi:GTP-binding protein